MNFYQKTKLQISNLFYFNLIAILILSFIFLTGCTADTGTKRDTQNQNQDMNSNQNTNPTTNTNNNQDTSNNFQLPSSNNVDNTDKNQQQTQEEKKEPTKQEEKQSETKIEQDTELSVTDERATNEETESLLDIIGDDFPQGDSKQVQQGNNLTPNEELIQSIVSETDTEDLDIFLR